MRRQMLDRPLRALSIGQVADRKNLAASSTIFDRLRRNFEDMIFVDAGAQARFGGMAVRRFEGRAVAGDEPVGRGAAGDCAAADAKERAKPRVHLDDPSVICDRKRLERRVGKAMCVGKPAVDERSGEREGYQRDIGDDDRGNQPVAAARCPGNAATCRIGDECGRRHRGKMQDDNGEHGESCRQRNLLPALRPREGKKRGEKAKSRQRHRDEDRCPVVGDARGGDDRRHADKVHRRDADCRPHRRERAATRVRRLAQPAETAPKEGDRDGDRQDGQADVEANRHRSAIGEHRDEMRRPYPHAFGYRGDHKPVAPAGVDAVR